MSTLNKFLKVGTIKTTALEDSTILNARPTWSTPVYVLNLAWSGKCRGGLVPGLISLAGKSKHFKTLLGLIGLKAFLDADPEHIVFFYDSEFGASRSYFETFGIDMNRCIHIPIMNIEELKFDIMQKLKEVDPKTDKIMIFIDSIGNLPSIKEIEDALKENSAADMTRAKQLKSLWRMVTPYLKMKNIPCIAINHVYDSMSIFPSAIMSGGQGGMLSSDTVIIMGKRQIKNGTETVGSEFIMNMEKSRDIKEKSKIPLTVTYEHGVDIYSGLLEFAQMTGHVIKPTKGRYSRPCVEGDKSWFEKNTSCEEFWKPVIDGTDFLDRVDDMFSLSSNSIFTLEDEEEYLDKDTGEVIKK